MVYTQRRIDSKHNALEGCPAGSNILAEKHWLCWSWWVLNGYSRYITGPDKGALLQVSRLRTEKMYVSHTFWSQHIAGAGCLYLLQNEWGHLMRNAGSWSALLESFFYGEQQSNHKPTFSMNVQACRLNIIGLGCLWRWSSVACVQPCCNSWTGFCVSHSVLAAPKEAASSS